MHIGIDYGSKLAGTTAICYRGESGLVFKQSKIKEDSDEMILQFIQEHSVKQIFIDAPLSLPPAYFGKGDDFFYRVCDRELQAMSPMFLGGLTARAMKLKSEITQKDIEVIEIYPTIPGKKISEKYKKDKLNIQSYLQIMNEALPFQYAEAPSNWHQIDSVLAWDIGQRYLDGKAESFGVEEEGLIWV